MFEAFFKMEQTPFSRDIPTKELMKSKQMTDVLGRLNFAAERQLFIVITGECGTGKTTTIRCFSEQLDQKSFKLLYLSDSKLTPRHFYKGLLEQLGCEAKFYRGDSKRQLHKEIESLRTMHGLMPVVVIDEAHLLDKEMLEEVRFLLNFKMDAQSPMALVLVGQTELRDKLTLQSFMAIRQRIDLTGKLNHLDRAQTEDYILNHLRYAGVQNHIFSESAIDEVHGYAGGIPRMINKACTQALIYACVNEKHIIDDHIVQKVIKGELT
ncbi:MAG: ExeA family protein [Bacilli bacterium]